MAPPARGELTPVQEEPDAASPPSDSMRNSNNSNPTAAVAEASDATETENLNAGDAATEVARILCCFMRKLWWLEMVNFIEVLEDIGILVFGMSVFLSLSIWNGFGIS